MNNDGPEQQLQCKFCCEQYLNSDWTGVIISFVNAAIEFFMSNALFFSEAKILLTPNN